MEKFVRNFIGMSIVYLAIAVVFGVLMVVSPKYYSLKFVHSHLMMLGWVSMMIYGVGYHILPRFAGKLIKSRSLGEAQFWLSNIGLVGLLVFYALMEYYPQNTSYRTLTVIFAAIETLSIFLFFYNMMATLYGKETAH